MNIKIICNSCDKEYYTLRDKCACGAYLPVRSKKPARKEIFDVPRETDEEFFERICKGDEKKKNSLLRKARIFQTIIKEKFGGKIKNNLSVKEMVKIYQGIKND